MRALFWPRGIFEFEVSSPLPPGMVYLLEDSDVVGKRQHVQKKTFDPRSAVRFALSGQSGPQPFCPTLDKSRRYKKSTFQKVSRTRTSQNAHNPTIVADLSTANLYGADLGGADLSNLRLRAGSPWPQSCPGP